MTSELKPCPFCGGEARMYTRNNAFGGTVGCVNIAKCGVRTLWMETPEQAIAAWNQRVKENPCT
jgi:Lar family restriction alleviation protein